MLGERHVVGKAKVMDVGHDVVGAERLVAAKAGVCQDREQEIPPFGVLAAKLSVVTVVQVQRESTRLLQGMRSAYREEVVNFANGVGEFGRGYHVADAPAG